MPILRPSEAPEPLEARGQRITPTKARRKVRPIWGSPSGLGFSTPDTHDTLASVNSQVDRAARNQLSQGIRWLAAGTIDTGDFEDRFGHSAARARDPGVRAIFWQGAWVLYSDFERTPLRGMRRLSRDTRRAIARWIIFLDSDLPYEWPLNTWWHRLLHLPLNLLTLGSAGRWRFRRWSRSGEVAVWPFLRWSDYRACLRRPRRLGSPRGVAP